MRVSQIRRHRLGPGAERGSDWSVEKGGRSCRPLEVEACRGGEEDEVSKGSGLGGARQ